MADGLRLVFTLMGLEFGNVVRFCDTRKMLPAPGFYTVDSRVYIGFTCTNVQVP